MRFITLILVALSLSGCTTAATRYRNEVQSYVGKPEGEVIARFGVPNSTYQSGKSKYLSYQGEGRTVAVPMGNGFMAMNQGCKTTFILDETLTVSGASAEGKGCR